MLLNEIYRHLKDVALVRLSSLSQTPNIFCVAFIKEEPMSVITLYRLSLMWSVYNLVLLNVVLWLPQLQRQDSAFVDFVRASSLIVAAYWIVAYIWVGPNEIFKMYQSLFPGIEKPTYYVVDFCTHFLPLIALGFPKYIDSYLLAACVITVWYTAIRSKIIEIYEILPIQQCDIVVYGGFLLCVTMVSLSSL